MAKYPSDLPFHKDDSPRMIPWIIGIMVYLATLSLVASISLSRIIDKWDEGFRNGFSVELSPPEGSSSETLGHELERQKKVLDVLAALPGIRRTQVIAKTAMSSTADSWLGTEEENMGLPLPTIIDVEILPGAPYDIQRLQQILDTHVPGTTINSDREWREGLKQIALIFLAISVVVASLIGFAAIAISAFTAHTGLIIYHKIIEILHLVGAQNTYIARQFQNHTCRLAVRAGLIGLSLSLVTFLGLTLMASQLELPNFLKDLPLLEMILVTVSIPIIVALTMMTTARLTVLWELKDMA